ncbi:MAG TPA: hypothetical protein P5238_02520 [Smithellaceae bacterium]|nr:hypothetical protein [Smithellaceae bacterium]HRV43980.1 hypothetical protein [Smithellaceae bacterium]
MKVFKIKFGKSGEAADAFGIRFLGDFDDKVGQGGSFSVIISSPDSAPLVTHQRITIWFTFEKIRPYDDVTGFIRRLTELLKEKDYIVKYSFIDGLFNTTLLDRTNPAQKLSEQKDADDAAAGFSVTAEKQSARLKFTVDEIVSVSEVAAKLGRTIYGRNLERVRVNR